MDLNGIYITHYLGIFYLYFKRGTYINPMHKLIRDTISIANAVYNILLSKMTLILNEKLSHVIKLYLYLIND